MPGLLDYVKGYQHGGGVDFDPYATTSQADMLAKLGITVDSDAMGLLPTYDPTGADMAREAYDLRGQSFGLQREALGLRGRGLDASLATARRGGTGSLLDLTQQGKLQEAGTGFVGSGAGAQTMTNVRGDIISGFGDVSADIGRQRSVIAGELSGLDIDESQSYLDLQQDIWRMQQGYESDLLGALGDLDSEDWNFGTSNIDNPPPGDPCGGECSGHSIGTPAYSFCIQMCEESLGDDEDITSTDCPPGYSYINGGCVKDDV